MCMNYSTCRIGQSSHCESKGCCEWLRVFGASCNCASRGSAPDLVAPKKQGFDEMYPDYKKSPAYKPKSIIGGKKQIVVSKRGKVVENKVKYIEIDNNPIQEVQSENKFKLADQDDWIKKIKVKL